MRPISKDKQNSIKNCLEKGQSVREIAQKLGIGKSTVSRVAKKLFPDRKVHIRGSPPKLSVRSRLYCVRQVTSGAKENAVEVAKSLGQDKNIMCMLTLFSEPCLTMA